MKINDSDDNSIESFFEEAKRIAKLNALKEKEAEKFSISRLLLGGIFLFIAFCLIWLYGVFAYGFVITKLWAWFIVPVFASAATVKLGIFQAAGIFMLVRFLTAENFKITSDENQKEKWTKAGVILLYPWITLLFGWFLHLLT